MERLYNVKEAAEFLGLTIYSIYALAHSGKLKSIESWKGAHTKFEFKRKHLIERKNRKKH